MGEFIEWCSKRREYRLKSLMLPEVVIKRQLHMTDIEREHDSRIGYCASSKPLSTRSCAASKAKSNPTDESSIRFHIATPTGFVPTAPAVSGLKRTAQSSNSSRSTTMGLAIGLSVRFIYLTSLLCHHKNSI